MGELWLKCECWLQPRMQLSRALSWKQWGSAWLIKIFKKGFCNIFSKGFCHLLGHKIFSLKEDLRKAAFPYFRLNCHAFYVLIRSKGELHCMVIRTLDFEPGRKVPVSGLLVIYLCNWERFSIALCEETPSGHILLLFRNSRLKVLKLTNWGHRRKSYFCGKNAGPLSCQSFGMCVQSWNCPVKAGLEMSMRKEALLFSVSYSLGWLVEGSVSVWAHWWYMLNRQ